MKNERQNVVKEYKVSITGITDFIIISPEVLRLLLEKIKDSVTLNVEIPAEYIMPMKFAEYIKAVINVNRDKTQFRFKQITEDEIIQWLSCQDKNLRFL